MGVFSRFFEAGKDDAAPATSSLPSAPAGLPSSGGLESSGPSLATPQFNPPHVPQVPGAQLSTGEVEKLYNPYAGLQHVKPRNNQVFRVQSQPQFVFVEEAAYRRRGFWENVVFYTGAGYLGGSVCGGTSGFVQGTVQKPPPGVENSRRLLLNRLLNSTGQTGRLAGNTAGCLGLLFAGSESFAAGMLDSYAPWTPTWLPTVLGGATAGAIFRSPRGGRAAAVTAGVGAAAAACLAGVRQVFPGA